MRCSSVTTSSIAGHLLPLAVADADREQVVEPAAQPRGLGVEHDGGRQRALDVGHGLLRGRRQRRPPLIQRDAAGALARLVPLSLAVRAQDHTVVLLVPQAVSQADAASLAHALGHRSPAGRAAQAGASAHLGDAPGLAPPLQLLVGQRRGLRRVAPGLVLVGVAVVDQGLRRGAQPLAPQLPGRHQLRVLRQVPLALALPDARNVLVFAHGYPSSISLAPPSAAGFWASMYTRT